MSCASAAAHIGFAEIDARDCVGTGSSQERSNAGAVITLYTKELEQAAAD